MQLRPLTPAVPIAAAVLMAVAQCASAIPSMAGVWQQQRRRQQQNILDLTNGGLEGDSLLSAAPPFTPFRTANFLSASKAYTAVVADVAKDSVFVGTECYRRYSSDDCHSLSGTIELWDTATQTKTATLTGHNASIMALAYDPARQLLWSASDEAEAEECCGSILQWDTSYSPPRRVATLKSGHEFDVCEPRKNGAARIGVAALHYDPKSHRLFGSCASTVMQWDVSAVAGGRQLPSVAVQGAGEDSAFNPKMIIRSLAFDPSHEWLFAAKRIQDEYVSSSSTAQRQIVRWSVADGGQGTRLPDLEGHLGGVTSLAFDVGRSRLYSGSDNNELAVWDSARNLSLAVVMAHVGGDDAVGDDDDDASSSTVQGVVSFLQYDAASKVLVSANTRGLVIKWDVSLLPPKPVDAFACAVQAMPPPMISMRLRGLIVDSLDGVMYCASACVDGSSFDTCAVQGLVETWQLDSLSPASKPEAASASASCTSALQQLCGTAQRATAGNCFLCCSTYQAQLQSAQCTSANVDSFCA
eukprot:SAG25_NODE_325_length_9774_cov_10.836899_5_plen_527_part_00